MLMCELQPSAIPSACDELAWWARLHGISLLARHLRARSLPDLLPYQPPELGLGQEEQPSTPASCWTKPDHCLTTAQAGRACRGLRHRAGAQLQRSGQIRSGCCTKWLLCSTMGLQASAWPSPTSIPPHGMARGRQAGGPLGQGAHSC